MWGLHGNDTEVKFMLEQLPQRHKEANDPWRRTTAPARVSTGRNTTRPTFLLVVLLISLYIIHTSLRHLKAAAAVTSTNTTVPVAAATNGATAVAVFFTCITDQSEIHPLVWSGLWNPFTSILQMREGSSLKCTTSLATSDLHLYILGLSPLSTCC